MYFFILNVYLDDLISLPLLLGPRYRCILRLFFRGVINYSLNFGPLEFPLLLLFCDFVCKIGSSGTGE